MAADLQGYDTQSGYFHIICSGVLWVNKFKGSTTCSFDAFFQNNKVVLMQLSTRATWIDLLVWMGRIMSRRPPIGSKPLYNWLNWICQCKFDVLITIQCTLIECFANKWGSMNGAAAAVAGPVELNRGKLIELWGSSCYGHSKGDFPINIGKIL